MNQTSQLQTPRMPVMQPVKTGVGAVAINIYNPTAQTGQSMPLMPNYIPNYYYPNINTANRNNNTNVANQNNNINVANQNNNVKEPVQAQTAPVKAAAPVPSPTPSDVIAAKSTKSELKTENINKIENKNIEKKVEEKPKEKKEVVPLTDEYLKKLSTSLNTNDKNVRATAMKEIIKRFREDDKRKDDVALTNLLNRGLQDNSSNVRLLALATLDEGIANGNNKTRQILQDMTKSTASYGEDAKLASQILVKIPQDKVTVEGR